MVFGWGKKKQEEIPVEEIPQSKDVHLDDVSKIVTELYELRTNQTISEIKSLRDNTDPLISELIKIGKVLENDDLQVDDIDKHLAIIVVRGKKQVIDVIKKGVNNLPDVSDIDSAKKLNIILNQTLKMKDEI